MWAFGNVAFVSAPAFTVARFASAFFSHLPFLTLYLALSLAIASTKLTGRAYHHRAGLMLRSFVMLAPFSLVNLAVPEGVRQD